MWIKHDKTSDSDVTTHGSLSSAKLYLSPEPTGYCTRVHSFSVYLFIQDPKQAAFIALSGDSVTVTMFETGLE